MFDLPKTTEYNTRIPKQKFYDGDISASIKQLFMEQIKSIYWKHKIAATTVNLASGKEVTEVEIFEIQLNQQFIEEAVLKYIDRKIPYHILYLLKYQDMCCACIGYKENTTAKQYYYTDWMDSDGLVLRLDGLNVDQVYENYVRQIAGNRLQGRSKRTKEYLSLKEDVEKDTKRQRLLKQIEKLETKIRRERQLNKQIELRDSVRKLQRELEELG